MRLAAFVVIIYNVLYISDALIYMGIIVQPYVHVTMHIAVMLFFIYLLVPAKKGAKRNVPPWYDILLAVLSIVAIAGVAAVSIAAIGIMLLRRR